MHISKKTTHIMYWITTLLLALFILPGLFFMHSEMAVEGMQHVGLGDAVWLQQLVGRGAPLAILLILFPQVPARLKERSYVGLGCIYIGAFWAHVQIGDPISQAMMAVVVFVVLLTSYLMWHRMIDKK